jgi:7-cyano-7-deazaguanine synthase
VIVLLSAGLDSTVNLYEARTHGKIHLALTFDYGQRAAAKEIEFASKTCEHLKVSHKVISLPWLKEITNTSLVNPKSEVPKNMDIDKMSEITETAKKVWVPNRNGVFLSIAASFAESLGAKTIVPGFNREEATTFPDNSGAFLESFTDSLSYSTLSGVEVQCFTTELNKTEIARKGRELEVKFEYVWPCYFAGPEHCGECESCLRYDRAMRESLE